jgi:purine-binding chemotaxis protein CheW
MAGIVARVTRQRLLLVPLHDEVYALDLDQVVEVVPAPSFAILPTAPPALRGVFNVRGEIVPLFDTSVLLGGARCKEVAFGVVIDTPDGHVALTATAMPSVVDLSNGREGHEATNAQEASFVLHDGRIATPLRVTDLLHAAEPRDDRSI